MDQVQDKAQERAQAAINRLVEGEDLRQAELKKAKRRAKAKAKGKAKAKAKGKK